MMRVTRSAAAVAAPAEAATADAPEYREEGTFELTIGEAHYCVPRFCPHRGGRLSHGVVNAERRTIRCPLHHSVFSLETGEQLAGPACGALAVQRREAPCIK